ncbi:hypothetical protein P692DRAFT_20821982 [Suillus brevipes Sb2]|nr:hypothetical protein P692DRAFT_20821982 [Suillus brevipes Sb2]
MASIPVPSIFKGKETENPQNFLREVERYIYLNRIMDEATKKTTWDNVRVEFGKQWPAIVVAAKSQLDYQKELLAPRLKEEDVGEQITVAGVMTWSHLHYHGHLQRLFAKDCSSTTWEDFLNEIKGADVDIIQDKVKREKEKKEVEREQNARIARLESRQPDPVEALRMQMQHYNQPAMRHHFDSCFF